MLDPGPSQRGRYSAFISYSRRDERDAAWLQSALESYRVPRNLVGKPTPAGPVPARLAPMFRDRLELSAAPDLETALADALAASDALVVVCSPASAKSAWVNREIDMFRAMGRGDRIFAALFAGDETDAFPPALLHGEDEKAITPMAADFRKVGDGKRLGKLKLLAVLTGVSLEDLLHREQDRRIRTLTGFAGATVGIAGAFAFVAVAALNAEARAEREQVRAERLVEALLTDLRKAVQPVGSLALNDRLNDAALTYFRGQSLTDMPDAALAQRARLLLAMGEDDFARGKIELAAVQFAEAHRTTAARLDAKPDDPQRIFDHAQSEFWRGYTAWETQDFSAARQGFQNYAKLSARLLAINPQNADWQMEAGYADSNLGILTLRQAGDGAQAETTFSSALAHFQAAKAQRPLDRDIAHQIADGLGWLADSQRMQKNLPSALENREKQRAMLLSMQSQDVRDASVEIGLVHNSLALARIEVDEFRLAAAQKRLAAAKLQAQANAESDPMNRAKARQVRIIALFEAQVGLRLPPATRPSLDRVEAAIGQCSMDDMPGQTELADFCRLVLARLRLAQGRETEARALADDVQSRQTSKTGLRLSQIYGIDFAAELAALQ